MCASSTHWRLTVGGADFLGEQEDQGVPGSDQEGSGVRILGTRVPRIRQAMICWLGWLGEFLRC